MIRPPTALEIPALRRIERAAGRAFAAVGLPEVAADEPPPLVHLEAFRLAGRAWVATDADGRPAAYLVAQLVDGRAHVEQVSVDPAHRGTAGCQSCVRERCVRRCADVLVVRLVRRGDAFDGPPRSGA